MVVQVEFGRGLLGGGMQQQSSHVAERVPAYESRDIMFSESCVHIPSPLAIPCLHTGIFRSKGDVEASCTAPRDPTWSYSARVPSKSSMSAMQRKSNMYRSVSAGLLIPRAANPSIHRDRATRVPLVPYPQAAQHSDELPDTQSAFLSLRRGGSRSSPSH